MTPDEASIRALQSRFVSAIDRRDAEALMQCYRRDERLWIFDATPPRQIRGWEAYRAAWKAVFAAYPGPASVELMEAHVTVSGTLAYGHSIQEGHLTRPDGTLLVTVFRVTSVFQKLAGEWLIVHEHVSVPVDIDSLQALAPLRDAQVLPRHG